MSFTLEQVVSIIGMIFFMISSLIGTIKYLINKIEKGDSEIHKRVDNLVTKPDLERWLNEIDKNVNSKFNTVIEAQRITTKRIDDLILIGRNNANSA